MQTFCIRHNGSFHGDSILSGVSGETRVAKMASITQRPTSRQYYGALCAAQQQHRIEDQTASSVVQGFPWGDFGPFLAQKGRVKDRVQLTCSRSRVEEPWRGFGRINAHGAMPIRPRGRPWHSVGRRAQAGGRRGHRGRGLTTGRYEVLVQTVHMQAAQLQRSIGLAGLRHPETADWQLQTQRSAARPARQKGTGTGTLAPWHRDKRAAAIFCASCACAVCASPVDTDTQTVDTDADTRAPQPPETQTTKRKRQSLLCSCLLQLLQTSFSPVPSNQRRDCRSCGLVLVCTEVVARWCCCAACAPPIPARVPRGITSWTVHLNAQIILRARVIRSDPYDPDPIPVAVAKDNTRLSTVNCGLSPVSSALTTRTHLHIVLTRNGLASHSHQHLWRPRWAADHRALGLLSAAADVDQADQSVPVCRCRDLRRASPARRGRRRLDLPAQDPLRHRQGLDRSHSLRPARNRQEEVLPDLRGPQVRRHWWYVSTNCFAIRRTCA